MSLKNCSKLIRMVHIYLGYYDLVPNAEIDDMINDCIEELENLNSFRYMYQEFSYELPFVNKNQNYKDYLKGASKYYLVAMTLGNLVDARIRYYGKIDAKKMIVFDATSSAYLEYLSDDYEQIFGEDRSFRFCPGYNGTSVEDLREIFPVLHPEKIGITLLESNIMVPQKTMVGLVCVGKQNKKKCDQCVLFDKCTLRREKKRCSNY